MTTIASYRRYNPGMPRKWCKSGRMRKIFKQLRWW